MRNLQEEVNVTQDEETGGEADELAAARAVLAAHEQQVMQACAEEIQAVLAKYGMRLEVTTPQIVLSPANGRSS